MAVSAAEPPTPAGPYPAEVTPAQNLDAEESVLGAVLLSARALEAISGSLSASDFYRSSHATIYRVALALHARGEPVDAITICDALERDGKLDDIGGRARINELAALVPATSNVAHYARIVQEMARMRALARVGQEITRIGLEREGSAEELLSRAEQAVALLRQNLDAGTPAMQRLRFLPGKEFRSQQLARIDPLLGESNDALMMPGSLVLMAGIGGSGKTTLALHALAHWTAGLPWFGIAVARPLRVVVIENEGPHDPFARKVDDFANRFSHCTCSGEPHGSAEGIDTNTFFLDAPWGRFSFDDKGLAAELHDAVLDFGADLVVANPLGRLGMKGAGSPEETRAFQQLLTDAGLGEDFAALLLHHLAKAQKGTPLVQQISGDWGPHPDTILVLEEAGDRCSKLSFGKVRWGDQGRLPLLLHWLTDPQGPVGYRVQDTTTPEITDADFFPRIDEFLAVQSGPVGMSMIRKNVKGNEIRIQDLVERGASGGRYARSVQGSRVKFSLVTMPWVEPQLDLGEPVLGEGDES